MLAALSWLLDLDQGQAASSSSTSPRSSRSGRSDADAGAEADPATTHTTFSGAGGQLLAELYISSAAATLSGSASESATSPHGAVYSPQHLEESFADLEARKADFFAPAPCQEPAEDSGLGLSSLAGQRTTPALPLSLKTLSLGSLHTHANEIARLSPIPSPDSVPVCTTGATSLASTHEDERLLLASEGVMLSTRLCSPKCNGPCAAAERAEIANNCSAMGSTGVGVVVPPQKTRILEWDEEVHAGLQASLPLGLRADLGERAACSGTEAQERREQMADAEPEEVPLVHGALKAAFTVSTPPHVPALDVAALAPAAVPLRPSNPFLGITVGNRDAPVPCYSECIHDTPAQEDSGVVHLANGLVTVTPMDADDLHQQAEQSSPLLPHSLAAQLTAPTRTKQPHFDFS
ncbi:hypothetical protein LtaPh_1204200 [Leishmania tarentolae]|uniref:Proteophosphoglycan ppg4 n=1 Tax=Leishmania tarentolae TaxID=5689 RepID=A0A640KBV8_LEITA|nr:hypothetical protein LtaPh_1204200 [Leishmania tarentolae]